MKYLKLLDMSYGIALEFIDQLRRESLKESIKFADYDPAKANTPWSQQLGIG